MNALWTAIVVIGLLGGANKPSGDQAKREIAKLRGRWEVVAAYGGGERVGDLEREHGGWIFGPDKIRWKFSWLFLRGSYHLKHINNTTGQLSIFLRDAPPKRWFVLYRFEGNRLKLCLRASKMPRTFSSKPNGQILFILKWLAPEEP